MTMKINIVSMLHPDVQRKFHKNAHWALSGSIIYETLKVTHCFLLMQVLAPSLFGLVGSLLAILYFATYVVDFGATNSIPPFLHMFTRNKATFRVFLIRYSLAPHLPFILIGALLTALFVQSHFTAVPAYGIIGVLVVAEAIRSFLRFFLHITFQARHVVIVELILFVVVYLGMEGALPSVVAGLVDKPVIAVPTSVGYGTSFGGITALLAMLNSCSSGITVVNIDNGFGAGYAASLINRQVG